MFPCFKLDGNAVQVDFSIKPSLLLHVVIDAPFGLHDAEIDVCVEQTRRLKARYDDFIS